MYLYMNNMPIFYISFQGDVCMRYLDAWSENNLRMKK